MWQVGNFKLYMWVAFVVLFLLDSNNLGFQKKKDGYVWFLHNCISVSHRILDLVFVSVVFILV